jgi:hypothetical protein
MRTRGARTAGVGAKEQSSGAASPSSALAITFDMNSRDRLL